MHYEIMLVKNISTPETATGSTMLAAGVASPCTALLSKRGVAALLNMSPRWVEARLSEGLPYLRFGPRRVRFDSNEVLAWVKMKYGAQRFSKTPRPSCKPTGEKEGV